MSLDFHRCTECGEMWTRPKFRACKHENALVETLSSKDVHMWDKDGREQTEKRVSGNPVQESEG